MFFKVIKKKPFFHCMLALRGWKTRPLQHFGAPGPGKRDPYSTLGPPGLENATPTALWAPLVRKTQPLQQFWPPGSGKRNPYSTFGSPGPEHATPTALWAPRARKTRPLQYFGAPGFGKCGPYNTLPPPPARKT